MTKKKILSIILTLTMILGVMPFAGLTASAESDVTTTVSGTVSVSELLNILAGGKYPVCTKGTTITGLHQTNSKTIIREYYDSTTVLENITTYTLPDTYDYYLFEGRDGSPFGQHKYWFSGMYLPEAPTFTGITQSSLLPKYTILFSAYVPFNDQYYFCPYQGSKISSNYICFNVPDGVNLVSVSWGGQEREADEDGIYYLSGYGPGMKIDVVCEVVHTHSFTTYTADGATLTATCSTDDCDLTDNKITLTLGADGEFDSTALKAWTDAGCAVPVINYYADDVNKGTEKPTEVGSYIAKASLTYGKPSVTVTAEKSFNILEDGYYLVGTLDGKNYWEVSALTPDMIFAENTSVNGEYILDWTFCLNDELKVAKLENKKITAWYNDGGENYKIDESKVGNCTVHFIPEGNLEWSYSYFTAIPIHTHSSFEEGWTADGANGHYHKCTGKGICDVTDFSTHTEDGFAFGEHTYTKTPYVCDTCGYEDTATAKADTIKTLTEAKANACKDAEDILDTAIASLESAETLEAIKNAESTALTDADTANRNLAQAILTAQGELDIENGKDPLTDETALENGKNALAEVKSIKDIDLVKATAIGNIQSAQAGELANAIAAAKGELDTENGKDPLNNEDALTTGKENIAKATTKNEVKSAKDTAIGNIQSAQAGELANAIAAAKGELDIENGKDPLNNEDALTTGKANIAKATTKAEVKSSKDTAIGNIQSAQALQLGDAKAEAIETLNEILNSDVSDNVKAAAQKAIDKINGAKTSDEVKTIVSDSADEMQSIIDEESKPKTLLDRIKSVLQKIVDWFKDIINILKKFLSIK